MNVINKLTLMATKHTVMETIWSQALLHAVEIS